MLLVRHLKVVKMASKRTCLWLKNKTTQAVQRVMEERTPFAQTSLRWGLAVLSGQTQVPGLGSTSCLSFRSSWESDVHPHRLTREHISQVMHQAHLLLLTRWGWSPAPQTHSVSSLLLSYIPSPALRFLFPSSVNTFLHIPEKLLK